MILSPANLSQTPPSSSTHFLSPPTFNKPPNSIFFPSKQTPLQILSPPLQCHSPHSSLSSDIDMVQTRDGVFAPNQTKVVVLWDLDNKPPRGPPYDAAVSLRTLAARFGEVVDISAYANRHAFSHLPARVIEERRARRQMDFLERKVFPADNCLWQSIGRYLDLSRLKNFKATQDYSELVTTNNFMLCHTRQRWIKWLVTLLVVLGDSCKPSSFQKERVNHCKITHFESRAFSCLQGCLTVTDLETRCK